MLSVTHLLLLTVIALLVWGPTKLPKLGRTLGDGLREFKKGLNGESDIDVTDSARHLPPDDEDSSKS